LLGEDVVGREYLIEHAGGLAIRTAQWKYIEQSNGQRKTKETNTELGNDTVGQLYDLLADPGEKNNVVKEHPEVVTKMKQELKKIIGKNPPQ
jgi:arylsulfatase A-like enzyme